MFGKKLCTNCETGKYYLITDTRSTFCPYLQCYNKGRCAMYKPQKKHILNFLHKLVKKQEA